MFGIERVKAVKLGPGIPGVEPPVDGGSGGVPFLEQGLEFPPQRVLVGKPLPHAAKFSRRALPVFQRPLAFCSQLFEVYSGLDVYRYPACIFGL